MKLEEEMPRPVFVDLKPNRDLLDAKFSGYKLSSEVLPTYLKELQIPLDKIGLIKDEISVQRLHIFANHNFLHKDPWNTKSFYVVDRLWRVYRISYETNENQFRFKEPVEFWTIPSVHLKGDGRFNVSLKFLDEHNAVVADGCGSLYLVETTNRSQDTETWNVVKLFEFCDLSKSIDPFVVQDAIKYKIGEEVFIDTLLVRVKDKDGLSDQDKHLAKVLESPDTPILEKCSKQSFLTTVSWITLKHGPTQGMWELLNTRSLLGTGLIRYGSFEVDASAITIASDNQFEFYYVDGQPLRYCNKRGGSTKKDEDEPDPDYLWKQSPEEITVWLNIPVNTKKTDLKIHILSKQIYCAIQDQVLLEGELFHPIKQDESVWTIEDIEEDAESSTIDLGASSKLITHKRIEIVLQKAELGQVWDEKSSIVIGKSSGKEISDLSMEDIENQLKSLSSDKKEEGTRTTVYDGEQLEECDSFPSDTSCLMRIGKDDQCITHITSLSSHQWLFSSAYGTEKPPSFCIRHDVDALVWQPPTKIHTNDRTSAETWKMEHTGTFLAMGYVQASKTDRRFVVFPEDLSFVALIDAIKHVYIYRQSVGVQTDLRNRRTGERVSHVAKQLLVSIDPPLDIIGAAAVEDFLFVLTTHNIHAVRVQHNL